MRISPLLQAGISHCNLAQLQHYYWFSVYIWTFKPPGTQQLSFALHSRAVQPSNLEYDTSNFVVDGWLMYQPTVLTRYQVWWLVWYTKPHKPPKPLLLS
jgi:hypothetical protein